MSSAREDIWASVKCQQRFIVDQFHLVQKITSTRRRESRREKKAKTRKRLEAVPTTKYQHSDLLHPENCIRILELQAGNYDDLIVCELKVVTLSTSVNQYEALSYVWRMPGGDGTQMNIQVNGGSLEVGPSLHCALQFLRYSDRARLLWVDTICINQSNSTERSS